MLSGMHGAVPLDDITYKEPPRKGLGLVIWPACSSPGYQITTLETYWRDKLTYWPFRVTERDRLPHAIDQAKSMNRGALPIYVIQD